MAITDNKENNKENVQAYEGKYAPESHFTNEQVETNGGSPFTGPRSSSGIPTFGLSTRLAGLVSGGEFYERLYREISDKIRNLNETVKSEETYSVHKLLKSVHGLHYSGIVVCESKDDLTTAHILVIEKTGDYPDKIVENIAGVRYEILRTPADALDEKYISQAHQLVADVTKTEMSNVIITDGTLVPNEFDIDNEALVNELINNALKANHSELYIRLKNYTGVNLSEFIQQTRNGKFFINLYFNNEGTNFTDQTGMPIRQDVCISLTYKANNNNNNRSINQGNDTIDVVKTYGYIDFEWSPSNMAQMSTQKFVPNFVITHIDSQMAPTLDILMLGVASVLAINEDMNWMQAFRPTPSRKNEIDFNDIGALNIEGNIENDPSGFGKKYDTKSKTFTIIELNRFIQSLVKPNLMISIDVPKAGPETWFTSALQYIKFRGSKEAYDRLLNFLATLTNGAFQHFSTPVFVDVSNKIHGGYYKDKDGYKDIRHLSSYLSVANFINDTNQSPALIAQYTNTLYNTTIPSELRAAERKKYLDEMSGSTAVYKQYHDRMTFSAGFLSELILSLKLAGFDPVFTNMGAINDMFQRRSTTDFSGAMLGSDARILGQNNMYGSYYGSVGAYNRMF
jgi:hypothetical protein